MDTNDLESSQTNNAPLLRTSSFSTLTDTTTPSTPPSSFANGSMTLVPNALNHEQTVLDNLIREIQNRESGQGFCDAQVPLTYPLTQNDLRALDEQFRGNPFYEEKLSFDYFGPIQRFVIRLHSKIHEVVVWEIGTSIASRLREISSRSRNKLCSKFAEEIVPLGQATIKLASGSRHDPDISFSHENAKCATLVIEVAYSQGQDALELLAKEYICSSGSDIRVVVGIKIEHPSTKSKKASFSVWRPRLTTENGEAILSAERTTHETLRNDDGTPNPDAELRLSLSDFAPQADLKRFEGCVDEPICITSSEFCKYLERAERLDQKNA